MGNKYLVLLYSILFLVKGFSGETQCLDQYRFNHAKDIHIKLTEMGFVAPEVFISRDDSNPKSVVVIDKEELIETDAKRLKELEGSYWTDDSKVFRDDLRQFNWEAGKKVSYLHEKEFKPSKFSNFLKKSLEFTQSGSGFGSLISAVQILITTATGANVSIFSASIFAATTLVNQIVKFSLPKLYNEEVRNFYQNKVIKQYMESDSKILILILSKEQRIVVSEALEKSHHKIDGDEISRSPFRYIQSLGHIKLF